MSRKTELMEQILTSEEANKIIGYVSPTYGSAYALLWLFQAVGTVLDEAHTFPAIYRDEISPITARWTLTMWENEYGLATDSTLSIEQRQKLLLAKILFRVPMNPKRLVDIISASTGLETILMENTAPNTFKLLIRGYIKEITKLKAAIEEAKPAHLLCEILMAGLIQETCSVYWAAAASERKIYQVEVLNS